MAGIENGKLLFGNPRFTDEEYKASLAQKCPIHGTATGCGCILTSFDQDYMIMRGDHCMVLHYRAITQTMGDDGFSAERPFETYMVIPEEDYVALFSLLRQMITALTGNDPVDTPDDGNTMFIKFDRKNEVQDGSADN